MWISVTILRKASIINSCVSSTYFENGMREKKPVQQISMCAICIMFCFELGCRLNLWFECCESKHLIQFIFRMVDIQVVLSLDVWSVTVKVEPFHAPRLKNTSITIMTMFVWMLRSRSQNPCKWIDTKRQIVEANGEKNEASRFIVAKCCMWHRNALMKLIRVLTVARLPVKLEKKI